MHERLDEEIEVRAVSARKVVALEVHREALFEQIAQ